MKFPYIDTLNHEVPTVVFEMRNLTVGVFEHLEITSTIDLDTIIAYTQLIFRGSALKNYREVLVECRQLAKKISGDE